MIFKKLFLLWVMPLVATGVFGADLSEYQKTCVELGFKARTQAYSACVLKLERRSLMQRERADRQSVERKEQQEQERQAADIRQEQERLAVEKGRSRVEIVANKGCNYVEFSSRPDVAQQSTVTWTGSPILASAMRKCSGAQTIMSCVSQPNFSLAV